MAWGIYQFQDVGFIGRERLERVVKHDKPYKDSGNAYPYGDRRYSARHFRVLENGDYEIWNMNRTTVDDYLAGKDSTHDYRKWGLVGVVRADNTFEFTKSIGMSESMLLTEAMQTEVANDKRRGGAYYAKGKYMHPVFKGLRVDVTTGEAKTPYTTVHRTLNRKRALQHIKKYDEFKTVYRAMRDAMDHVGVLEVLVDMAKEKGLDDLRKCGFGRVLQLIDEKKYLDAGLLYGMNHGNGNSWYTAHTIEHVLEDESRLREKAENYKLHIKSTTRWSEDKFRRDIYAGTPEVFETYESGAGEKIPSSAWGFDVIVDGNVAERF
jgi:hypothetical protein